MYTARGADGSAVGLPLEVVDLPGHERLRSAHLSEVAPRLRALVYLVDASALQKQLRDVAEFLFAALTDPAVPDSARLLIACNKQVRITFEFLKNVSVGISIF